MDYSFSFDSESDGYDLSSYETDGFTSYDTTTSFEDGAISGIVGTFFVTYMVIILAVAALMIASWWKIFTKAGRKGYISLIPIYNTWVLYEIAGLKGWYVLLGLVPIFGGIALLVLNIMCYINLSKAFGKDGGFAAGLIFLPAIFFPILAFGKSQYQGTNAPAATTTANPVPSQPVMENNVTADNTNSVQEPTFVQPAETPSATEDQNSVTPDNNNQL